MLIEYRNDKLAILETDRAAESKIAIAIISSFRKKLVVLRAAPDERTLRSWKSLHYEKLSGDLEGKRSIRLNEKWRLVFELDSSTSPATITLLDIIDYH